MVRSSEWRWQLAVWAWLAFAIASSVEAQDRPVSPSSGEQRPADPGFKETVDVVEPAPLPGLEIPIDQWPAPVQTASDEDIASSGALDLADFVNRRFSGIHVNDTQGNPFQPDISYRGYTASPLLGTPQGLSVFMDGVRLNQPFGDVVSWDLIPRLAIGSATLVSGSNPLFGLNTLGGALSVQTKDGQGAPGTSVQAEYGSYARRAIEFEHGGHRLSGLHWYVAGNLFGEDGWRDESPSTVRQLFGKLGRRGIRHALTATAAYADNSLGGNGLQEQGFLTSRYASIYTKPDVTDNRSLLLNLATTHGLAGGALSAVGYYRNIRTVTVNGDVNEATLDQSVYQPTAAEREALLDAGYSNVPASGADATNTPFPFWRCLGNVLLDDEPASTCNALINRTQSRQHNAGASAQFTRRAAFAGAGHQFSMGGGLDRSDVRFGQTTELGYLDGERGVVGTGAFADGVTGGHLDGEPYDARVLLDGTVHTWSAYASDIVSFGRWHVTLSGRYNGTSVRNRDRIVAGGGPGSLDGDHTFRRFNPAAGLTFVPSASYHLYAGYSEGSRTPTSIELGCADPGQPCKLPNAMAGDPPLGEVVTGTMEAGVRGRYRGFEWSVDTFRGSNRHDLLFVTAEQTGFGYFRNFGETRRQGVELEAHRAFGRLTTGGAYTYLRATFESPETVNGAGNSSNDAAEANRRGFDGAIDIAAGDRLPLTPAHLTKAYAEVRVTGRLTAGLSVIAASRSYARGNENNLHQPDGIYYLGTGNVPGYAVVNLTAAYRLSSRLAVHGQIANLLNRRYYTAGQLGAMAFSDAGTFLAQALPPVGGEFPVRQSTFLAPGAPIKITVGVRLRL